MKTPVSASLVDGIRLRLRLVEPDDAEYIFSLRTDPAYATHLSSVSGTVEDQRAWIRAYKAKEAAGSEFYFVIERRDTGEPCGLVRLYDIEGDRFTWGSWILDETKPSKAALESAVLIYRVGFDLLAKRISVFEVRNENTHTISFHRRFGAHQTGRDSVSTYFEYSVSQFRDDKPRYSKLLEESEYP